MVLELEIPVPFHLDAFIRLLEGRRGRPIRVCRFTAPPGGPCGVWISGRDADYVFHDAGTSPYHQAHIVLHEIAHMLLGHGTAAGEGLGHLLAPGLGPELQDIMLGSAVGDEAEAEVQAEMLATLIMEAADGHHDQARCRVAGARPSGVLTRLQHAWGGITRRHLTLPVRSVPTRLRPASARTPGR
jgi:hypothetical protein